MKTQISFISILLLVVILSACNDKIEESFNEVETNLNMFIPVISEAESNLKGDEVEHAFSGTNEFYVVNIVHQKMNIPNIYDIKLRSGSYIRFSGIPENHGVTCLVCNWNYTSSFNSSNNIEESFDLLSLDYSIINGSFQVNIDSEIAQLIERIDDQSGVIKVEISGTCCNYINCIANLHIPITVTSKIYTPRFDLTF